MKKIDQLKALAIISVIILHSVPTKLLYLTFSQLHIWNAVPIFITLMAFTTYLSFSKLDKDSYYSKDYFIKRIKRILIPLIPCFLITFIISYFNKTDVYLGLETLIGKLPLSGPGNYYITILFQFILLSPLMFKLYKNYPKLSLFGSFLINFISELLFNRINIDPYLYSSSIFRYLFLIFLGFYLIEIINNNLKISKFIKIGSVFSIIYLILCSIPNFKIPFFISSWKTQLFVSNFYTILLVYLFFNYKTDILDKIILIGKSSYHIFLIQMIFFIVNPFYKLLINFNIPIIFNLPISLILNLLFCLFTGILFYKLENKIVNKKDTN